MSTPGWKLLSVVALGSAALTAVVVTVAMRPADQAASGSAVRDYLLAHPEVIPEAMEKLKQKDSARLVDQNRKAIETPFAGAWAGAKDGDVTLVQFYDYACGYCRASLPDIKRLLAEDPKIRIVYRELPILSAESEDAARVSLAAAEQGRFTQFHEAMWDAGRPAADTIASAEAKAGLNPATTATTAKSQAVEQELVKNIGLMRTLGIAGTPAWVVGDQMLSGAVGYDALKKAVAEARAAKS